MDFAHWLDADGLLHEDGDPRFPSNVYGVTGGGLGRDIVIQTPGACYGYVQAGKARVSCPDVRWDLDAGQWFATPSAAVVVAGAYARVLLVQRMGYHGVSLSGGPIEHKGRLRYIDGCSDTLLAAPPILGDPCLNHLHFPAGVDQTQHTHPSLRAGIVARGRGECITPAGTTPLVPGLIFVIPTDGLHRFRTTDSSMDVIAYHPDSDWGPTHEDHPMVNRTLVGGAKIDNSSGVHSTADFIVGYQP